MATQVPSYSSLTLAASSREANLEIGVSGRILKPTRLNVLSFAFLTSVTISAATSYIPFVIVTHNILYELTSRNYFGFPLAIARTVEVWSSYLLLKKTTKLTSLPAKERKYQSVLLILGFAVLSFVIYGILVPIIFASVHSNFFTEPDGTVAVDWSDFQTNFFWATIFSGLAAVLHLGIILTGVALLCGTYVLGGETIFLSQYWFDMMESRWLCLAYRRLVLLCLLATLPFLVASVRSCYIYLPHWEPPSGSTVGPFCDPMDETECLMPFPSSFFTEEDMSTVTGRRVAISREALKTIYKGKGPVHPSFLNDLDGFSTIGSMVFYLDGFEEGGGKLPGPDEIELSVTPVSITLLLDVNKGKLIHHFSELDLIDQARPSVILQPAAPLQHNTTYAVAMINALDRHGEVLPPSKGLRLLLDSSLPSLEQRNRSIFYKESVIPALNVAAPWLAQEGTLQLLFDFHTVSAESQLGPARKVRDAVLQQISNREEGTWKNGVRAIKIINKHCWRPQKDFIARIIHLEIDVPWFLDLKSQNHGASYLETESVESGKSMAWGKVKFVVVVPCSLVQMVKNATELRAIVDIGHTFLQSRQELLDSRWMHKLANKNGWILVSSDWRGMSNIDLPMIVRTLVADPNGFRSVRDNLIQGYAARAAIQLFCREALLDINSMRFDPPIHRQNHSEVRYLFYGISEGGIMGGAYSALTGPTGLLDGAILGDPGTPFSLLMSRSDLFPGYRDLLLLNVYYPRHVRLVVSLMQMAWDSVEGTGGFLAPPVTEPFPTTLIYAGLGDSTVTTIGSEILARAYSAETFANNPKAVFGLGIHRGPFENLSSTSGSAIYTELLYESDALSIQYDKTKSGDVVHNDVHLCTRLDPAIQHQIEEFVNNGRIIDPCESDGCIRSKAWC